LFVRKKCHARVKIHVFFRSSHGVKTLIIYKVLVVISCFPLKIALKCLLRNVSKIVCTSDILD